MSFVHGSTASSSSIGLARTRKRSFAIMSMAANTRSASISWSSPATPSFASRGTTPIENNTMPMHMGPQRESAARHRRWLRAAGDRRRSRDGLPYLASRLHRRRRSHCPTWRSPPLPAPTRLGTRRATARSIAPSDHHLRQSPLPGVGAPGADRGPAAARAAAPAASSVAVALGRALANRPAGQSERARWRSCAAFAMAAASRCRRARLEPPACE